MKDDKFKVYISQHKTNGMYAVTIEKNDRYYSTATRLTINDCKEYIFEKVGDAIDLNDIAFG